MKRRFLVAAALLSAGLAVSCGNTSQKTVTSQPVAGNWSLQAALYRPDIAYCAGINPPLCTTVPNPVPDPSGNIGTETGKVAVPVYQATLVPSDSCSLTDSWTRTALPLCTSSSCTQTFAVAGPKCFIAKADATQGSLTCQTDCGFLVSGGGRPLQPVALLVGTTSDPATSGSAMEYVLELQEPADANGPPINFFTQTLNATIQTGVMQGDFTCGLNINFPTTPTWANDCDPVGFYGTFEATPTQ